MNLTGCEIRFTLFGPDGPVQEWSLTDGDDKGTNRRHISHSNAFIQSIQSIDQKNFVNSVYMKPSYTASP
jgi:hypothetical protein